MAVTVTRLFPDSTIVCLASGPSLTREDVEYCRGRAPVIAVNDTYRWAPFADVLYACDEKWWAQHEGVPSFTGLKYSIRKQAAQFEGVQVLENAGDHGIEVEPTGLRTGKNSGYQAVNLAVLLGARRILLLGYDMQVQEAGYSHFFGDHPRALRESSPYGLFISCFETMVAPLAALGVAVINCSRESALTMFPRMPLHEALP